MTGNERRPDATPGEAAQYDRPIARIRRIIVVLGALGVIFVSVTYGVRSGAGFLLGAIASLLSFWRQQRTVEALGPQTVAKRPPVRRFIVQFGMLALAGYVIVKYLGVNRIAVVSGLLLAGVAVTIEILYELIFSL